MLRVLPYSACNVVVITTFLFTILSTVLSVVAVCGSTTRPVAVIFGGRFLTFNLVCIVQACIRWLGLFYEAKKGILLSHALLANEIYLFVGDGRRHQVLDRIEIIVVIGVVGLDG